MKTLEQIAEERNDEKIKAAKKYAKQYEGLMYTIGSIAGVSGIQRAFERGVAFGLHQALEITVEREKAERAAEQHWISVKERLPEKRDIGDIFLVWNAYDRDVSTVRWQPYGFDDVNDMYISHWMPLPAFPEDKGKAHWQELREFWKARNVTIPEWQEEK